MKFPCLLYKTPGPHRKPGVGTYRYTGCRDAGQFKALSEQGWFPSLADALKGEAPADDRDEMEKKAKALGIRGVHLMKDETLAARIAEGGQ